MSRYRPGVVAGAIAALVLVAGCQSAQPRPGAFGRSPAPSGDALRAALCAAGPGDVQSGGEPARAAQARYPRVTDVRAAYALSLLPQGIIDAAGLTVSSGTSASKLLASSDAHSLVIQEGSDAPPADMAADIMFLLAGNVVARSAQLDPAIVDLTMIADTSLAVSLDTYLKLAQTVPTALRGVQPDGDDLVSQAQKRLAGSSQGGLTGVNKAAFASAPQFWDTLAGFIGAGYYRPSPAIPEEVWLKPPVPAGQAAALSARLSPNCG